MIRNLFSVFDPSSSLFNNWISIFLGLIILPWSFWIFPSRVQIVFLNIFSTLNSEFSTLIGPKKIGAPLLLLALFSFILRNNFLGLFPYIFTATSHLTITLAIALPLWLSFILFRWIKETTHALAHLVPLGTPPVLIPFIVIIELVSNIIRPITLSVRLAANIIAGHLLLTLLGNQGIMASTSIVSVIIFAQILLLILEFSVSIIQAYVFATLTTLYARE